MRRCPRSVTVSFLAAAAAGVLSAAASAAPTVAGEPGTGPALTGPQQVAFLNKQRARHGFPADLVEVPAWSAACKRHMDYLDATGEFGHPENGPLRTAEGAWGGENSVLVSGGDAFDAEGVNAFEHAPIHLMAMLNPFMRRSGADRGCVVTHGDVTPLGGGPSTEREFSSPQKLSYPRHGGLGVPTTETTYEFPFVPGASVGLNVPGNITRSTGTGPHLYFLYAAAGAPGQNWNSRGEILSATLVGPRGPVEVRTVDNSTPQPYGGGDVRLGDYLPPGGMIIPVKPLLGGSDYTASVTFDPREGDPVSYLWSFRTAGIAVAGNGIDGLIGGGPATDDTRAAGGAISVPTVSKLTLKRKRLTFNATGPGALWLTVERQVRKKIRTRPAKWKLRRSQAVSAGMGRNQIDIKQLPKGTYRVRLRVNSAKGQILRAKTVRL